jgi:hypothetical protein
MYGEEKHDKALDTRPDGMQCTEFEARLADVLDGALSGEGLQRFEKHRAECPSCAPMYAAAETGLRWMKELKSEDVEPPARLVKNILRATSWADLPQQEVHQPWWRRVAELPAMASVLTAVRQPRFAMSFAMAFCSVSVLLSVTGVNVRDLRHLDLRPGSLVRNVAIAGGKVQKYYDNVKLVYEIESRVRDLKRATTPETPEPEKPKQQKQNQVTKPQGDEQRNYSLGSEASQWAALRGNDQREKGIWL